MFVQVHLRYQYMGDDDGSGNVPVSPAPAHEMHSPQTLSLPLTGSYQEVELTNLLHGWYTVCGEAVKGEKILEENCFNVRVDYVKDQSGQ